MLACLAIALAVIGAAPPPSEFDLARIDNYPVLSIRFVSAGSGAELGYYLERRLHRAGENAMTAASAPLLR